MTATNTTMTKPPFKPVEAELRDGRRALIRAAVPDDAAAVVRYMNTHLPGFSEFILTAPDEFDMDEQDEREWIERQASKPGCLALLAIVGEEVVAMTNCFARTGRRRIAHVGEIGMSIAKPWWGVGLGSRMMDALISWAEAHPLLGLLELGVYADNERALRLYKGHGFVEAGRIPRRTRFDDGSTRDDITMYRRVDGTLSDQPKPGDFHQDLGDGVVLRQLRYGDAEALFPMYQRNRERFRPWLRWEQRIKTPGDVRDAIAQWTEATVARGELTAVLESASTILGMLFVCNHSTDNHRMEIGYWLDQGQEGRGLATRGCRALIRWGFEEVGVNRFDITCQAINTRSNAVAERLGFSREGVHAQWQLFPDGRYVDVVRYRLLREEWEPEDAS